MCVLPNIGLYGKTPSRGDFVSEGITAVFEERWHTWTATGLARAKALLGDTWTEYYLRAPLWRFAASAGIFDEVAVCGVVMPSADAAGRMFPLAAAVCTPGSPGLAEVLIVAAGWLEKLENTLLYVLDADYTYDDLLASLARLEAQWLKEGVSFEWAERRVGLNDSGTSFVTFAPSELGLAGLLAPGFDLLCEGYLFWTAQGGWRGCDSARGDARLGGLMWRHAAPDPDDWAALLGGPKARPRAREL